MHNKNKVLKMHEATSMNLFHHSILLYFINKNNKFQARKLSIEFVKFFIFISHKQNLSLDKIFY
jgi:hypothetical protein